MKTNTTMKIQFVITRGETYGGAQRHVIEMASALHKLGHEVQVICGFGEVVPQKLESFGVPVVRVPSLVRSPWKLVHNYRAYGEIKAAIQAFSPDLVSTHSSKAGLLGRFAAHKCGVPAIFTAHGWSFSPGTNPVLRVLWRGLERFAARWCDFIVCVSETDRQLALAAGFPADKLRTIHNCRQDVDAKFRADHGDHHPVTINMIGRMGQQKDHQLLLKAMATLEDCRLVIVGDGDEKGKKQGELQALAQRLGITERVQFLGRVEDVAGPLSQADLFCLASHYEGFPRSTLEAMRAGLPVVVSDVGGSAEAVEEGITGFVVPPGDLEALRGALAKLVATADLRARMGAAGRRLYEERFTFERMFEATVAVYQAVLQEKSKESRE